MRFKPKNGPCCFCANHKGTWRANETGYRKAMGHLREIIIKKIFVCMYCYSKIKKIIISLRQTSKSLSLNSLSDECDRQKLLPRSKYVKLIILEEYDKI